MKEIRVVVVERMAHRATGKRRGARSGLSAADEPGRARLAPCKGESGFGDSFALPRETRGGPVEERESTVRARSSSRRSSSRGAGPAANSASRVASPVMQRLSGAL